MRSAPWRWMIGSVVPSSFDATAEDFDRLRDSAGNAIVDPFLGNRQLEAAGLGFVQRELADRAAAEQRRVQRLGQHLQRVARGLLLAFVGETELNAVLGFAEAGIADAGITQDLADVAERRAQPAPA
jgi:hypothetical protein